MSGRQIESRRSERDIGATTTSQPNVIIYAMNYTPEMAGVGRYSGEIGHYFASKGYGVCVITTPPHYPGWRLQAGHRAFRWTRETIDAAVVYRCPLYLHHEVSGVARMVAPLTFGLSSAMPALVQIIRRRPKYVIVVEPTIAVAPAALISAFLVGARTTLHVQDLEVEAAFAVGHLKISGIARRIAMALDGYLMRRFARIITISDRMAQRIRERGVRSDRIRIVRNWVDNKLITPKAGSSTYRRILDIADDTKVVLYSGNLGAKQGLGLLIAAAEHLSSHTHVQFVLAGDGPMRSVVAEAAIRLPNVRLLGFQPEKDFSEFLALADLHVLPQERDTADLLLPSKLGGMLASGRPILVTAEPGTELSEFLGDSCDFVPPGDAAALAAGILASLAKADASISVERRLALARRLSKADGTEAFEAAVIGD